MKKKWFIVILVLVVVAIVLTIVFINLFKERDTKALTEKLADVTQTGYLSRIIDEENKQTSEQGEENNIIHETLKKLKEIGESEFSKNDVNLITNYFDAMKAYKISIEFFAREMLFADASETYTKNHVKVQNLLTDAQKSADSFIRNINPVAQGSDYWTAQNWDDCRGWMETIINNTGNAIITLTEIYRDSVPMHVAHKGFMNNGFTDIIFDAMKEQVQAIITTPTEKADLGKNLYELVKAYLVKQNEGLILNYPYDKTLQENVEKIKKDTNHSTTLYQDFISGRWATI